MTGHRNLVLIIQKVVLGHAYLFGEWGGIQIQSTDKAGSFLKTTFIFVKAKLLEL